MSRVLSCVIYNIIKKGDLKIGCAGSHKHNGIDYNNVLGIGIQDILLTFVMSQILKNNDSVVILKCPNRTSENYFNKGFVIF